MLNTAACACLQGSSVVARPQPLAASNNTLIVQGLTHSSLLWWRQQEAQGAKRRRHPPRDARPASINALRTSTPNEYDVGSEGVESPQLLRKARFGVAKQHYRADAQPYQSAPTHAFTFACAYVHCLRA